MIRRAYEIPPDPRGPDQSRYPFKRQWCVCIPSCSRHLNLTFARLVVGLVLGPKPGAICFQASGDAYSRRSRKHMGWE